MIKKFALIGLTGVFFVATGHQAQAMNLMFAMNDLNKQYTVTADSGAKPAATQAEEASRVEPAAGAQDIKQVR